MGLSGIFLRKNEELRKTDITEVKSLFTGICEKLGYAVKFPERFYYGKTSCVCSVAEGSGSEKSFVMWLYSDTDAVPEYDKIAPDLSSVAIIESISGCEEMIFNILREYFELFPEDYFCDELQWYYTKRSIDRIAQGTDRVDWLYQHPPVV
jgi:hypothetical protein